MSIRETYAQVDLEALVDNFNFFKEESKKEVFAVVKADAYGHGAVQVAKRLEEEGIQFLCVSSLDEALELQEHGVKTNILIFSYVHPKAIEKYANNKLIFTIPSLSWFEEVVALNIEIRMHMEINTGMNRVGIKNIEDAKKIIESHMPIEGIYTHFSSAEENGIANQEQINIFERFLNVLNYDFKWIHAGNTHGALFVDKPYLNAVRVGIGLYGYAEFDEPLKIVMSLFSKVIHVDTLETGEFVGYNRTFKVNELSHFATIPIGYADGFLPGNQGLDIYINDKPYSIIGKICMDQLMVLVDESVQVYDTVELMGNHRTAKQIGDHLGYIPYVVITNIGARVPRIYK